MQDSNNGSTAAAAPSDAQILTRVSEGRFDENLTLIVKEIMEETLSNLDWWAGQVWWYLPNGLEPGTWHLHANAPASLNRLTAPVKDAPLAQVPTEYFHEPTLMPLAEATWLTTAPMLKSAGVRYIVALDIIADNRPSARLVFIAPSANSLGSDERQFLHASSLLLPKMVVRERVRTELHYRATHDPLTGLLNCLGLNQLLQLAPVAKKNLRAVLFLDLNKFKEVNDQFGHAIGDELLIHIANQLSSQVRPTDALARIGGDEFVIVASEVASREGAEGLAKRLWAAVSEPFQYSNGSSWKGTGSIGVALWQPGDTYAEALRQADMFMYRAKKDGGGIEVQPDIDEADAEATPDDLLSATEFSELETNQARGVMITLETVLRLPDTARLGAMIAERLSTVPAEHQHELWLKLPKSFWLDGERIAGLVEAVRQTGTSAAISLVLSCASASFESRLVARELIDRHSVGIVLDAFGSGNRDLEMLQLLTPVALVVDALSMQPEQWGAPDQTDYDWAVPRSVVAIANVLGIDAVAPVQATGSQLKSFKNLGCDLWFCTT